MYETKGADDISWFQARPEMSLRLIAASGVAKADAILDVGGGTSSLVDHLRDEGYQDLTVLDISGAALKQARARLRGRANLVRWIEADITGFRADRPFRLWHDRAVFQFLTDPDDRRHYAAALAQALSAGAHAILGTFAVDGPEKCSGLPVARYDADRMVAVLGTAFRLIEQVDETHVTPWQSEQRLSFFRLLRNGV
ncbi:MAG: trans-aconitate 2-methyltransferase [Limisphaerales bacterium]